MPSAAERGNNQFLKWRSRKKEMMIDYARGNSQQAWRKLRELMLFTNRNLNQILEDKRTIEMRDEFRQ